MSLRTSKPPNLQTSKPPNLQTSKPPNLRTSEQEPISKCKEIRWFGEKNRPRCTHRTPRKIFFENLEFQSSYDSQQVSTAEFRFNWGMGFS